MKQLCTYLIEKISSPDNKSTKQHEKYNFNFSTTCQDALLLAFGNFTAESRNFDPYQLRSAQAIRFDISTEFRLILQIMADPQANKIQGCTIKGTDLRRITTKNWRRVGKIYDSIILNDPKIHKSKPFLGSRIQLFTRPNPSSATLSLVKPCPPLLISRNSHWRGGMILWLKQSNGKADSIIALHEI